MTPSTATTNATLRRLLDDELAFSTTFESRYSNHLAMALVALDQLGAPDPTLQATFDRYAHGPSEPREDRAALDARIDEVERDGVDATLGRRIPPLATSPGTRLFHSMIRLGYGLDAHHRGQVAAGLLDWETYRSDVGIDVPTTGTRPLRDVAADLAVGRWDQTFDLGAVASRPEVQAAVADVRVDDRTLDDLAAFVLAAHIAADDFITLHLLTGTRALRTVADHLDPPLAAELVAGAVPITVVAYAAVGAPPIPDDAALDALRASEMPGPDELGQAATHSHDAHVVKLTDAALVEHRRTGDDLYLLAAARVLDLRP